MNRKLFFFVFKMRNFKNWTPPPVAMGLLCWVWVLHQCISREWTINVFPVSEPSMYFPWVNHQCIFREWANNVFPVSEPSMYFPCYHISSITLSALGAKLSGSATCLTSTGKSNKSALKQKQKQTPKARSCFDLSQGGDTVSKRSNNPPITGRSWRPFWNFCTLRLCGQCRYIASL